MMPSRMETGEMFVIAKSGLAKLNAELREARIQNGGSQVAGDIPTMVVLMQRRAVFGRILVRECEWEAIRAEACRVYGPGLSSMWFWHQKEESSFSKVASWLAALVVAAIGLSGHWLTAFAVGVTAALGLGLYEVLELRGRHSGRPEEPSGNEKEGR